MATKRVKPNVPTMTHRVNAMARVDRISTLPEPIIHHILSFVPTIDVIRMSCLSKRWRRVWYSIPTLDFSDADFREYFPSRRRKGFYKFLENCLKHRKACMRYMSDSAVTRLRLDIDFYGGSAALDKWLAFAIQSNVEELDLGIKPFRQDLYYSLPEAVLIARSLSVLKLHHLDLDGSFSTLSLPNLKYLELNAVKLCDEVLHNILSGIPSLERFLLSEPTNLSNPRISSSSLKFLEFRGVRGCQTIHVEAINLQSFVSVGNCRVINLSSCPEVRNLSLLHNFLDDKLLEDLILGLPLLENLSLSYCYELKHIRICGQNLKSIRLEWTYNATEVGATIEAPNLVSFCYKGNTKFRLSVKTPTHQLSGKFKIRSSFSETTNKDLKYINLITFLTNISISWKCLELHVFSYEDLIVPENLRKICHSPCPDLKHLKVKTALKSGKISDLKDALYWISPSLQTLTIEPEIEIP